MIKLHQEPLKILRSMNTSDEFAICLDHHLGSGGYGRVYKGFNNRNKYQKYAIKMIPITDLQRKESIQREVVIVSNIPKHDNLVLPLPTKIYSDSYFYIIMPLCNGGSLQNEIISRSKPYSEDEIYYIFYELISAYKELYDKKILHLDIKPANILIHEGRYKLADFGLSALLGTKEANDVKGTIKYMCPEILNKENYKASDKSDVYSLGVLMYYLIYKKHPYLSGENNHLWKPSILSQFSIRFNDFLDILTGMIQKNPVHRLFFNEVYQRMQNLPRIKKSYIRVSESYSFHNLRKDRSSNTYNIPANSSIEVENQTIQQTKIIQKLTMSKQILKLKQEISSDKITAQIGDWIQSYRNIIFLIDNLCKRLEADAEKIDDEDIRNCIYCSKLLSAAVIQQITKQIKTPKIFPKLQWNLYKDQLDTVAYNRVLKDQKYIIESRDEIMKDPNFDSQLKLLIKHKAITEETNIIQNYMKFYNEALRVLVRKKFQEHHTIVTSVLMLKMIDVTSSIDTIRQKATYATEFPVQVSTSSYSDNVKRLIQLSKKTNEEITAIDYSEFLRN